MDGVQSLSEVQSRGTSRSSSIFGSAHTVNRRLLASPGVLQLGHNNDMESDPDVEEYESADSDLAFSDSSDYYDGDDQMENGSEVEGAVDEVLGREITGRGLEPFVSTALDEDDHVISVEERAIIEEIKNQVKYEMKEELNIYLPTEEGKKLPLNDDPSLDDLEPKLKEAILKMRKYDRILEQKIKKEIEVKRERIHLQKSLRLELDKLNRADGKQPRHEELVNTEKFLALAPPPKHNEDVEDDSPTVMPVFATQLPDFEFDARPDVKGRKGSSLSRASGEASEKQNSSTANTRSRQPTGARRGGKSANRKRRKNFIKRNIEV